MKKWLEPERMREPIAASLFLAVALTVWWVLGFEWAVVIGMSAVYAKATIARPF